MWALIDRYSDLQPVFIAIEVWTKQNKRHINYTDIWVSINRWLCYIDVWGYFVADFDILSPIEKFNFLCSSQKCCQVLFMDSARHAWNSLDTIHNDECDESTENHSSGKTKTSPFLKVQNCSQKWLTVDVVPSIFRFNFEWFLFDCQNCGQLRELTQVREKSKIWEVKNTGPEKFLHI